MDAFVQAFAADFRMWATFAFVLVALSLYATETLAIETTSVAVIGALMVFFHVFPLPGPDGVNRLDGGRLVAGFANPALIAVLALLVVGQGMVRTGMLDRGAQLLLRLGGGRAWLSVLLVLVVVMVVSAFLNNIPVVVIFIPIMQALAASFGWEPGKVMMPLSFAAVLGGMTTLIGSGTNLLVNGALIGMDVAPFRFFDFTVPGVVLAGSGLLFVVLVVPRLLPERPALSREFTGDGKQFIAQIRVEAGGALDGTAAVAGMFKALPDMTVRLVQRGERAVLPPFEDLVLEHGDLLVVAATRKALTDALAKDPALLGPAPVSLDDNGAEPWLKSERMLAEVMIAPASRMVGQTLQLFGFHYKTGCVVLGIKRRSSMIRVRMTDTRLRAGDVMLVQGRARDVYSLRGNRDVVLLEWSKAELPVLHRAKRAMLVFLAVIAAAASGLVPIMVAALCGAVGMVLAGALNVRQAFRAVDSKVATMIPAALALGAAMQETGGATFMAHGLVATLDGAGPAVILSALFLLMAVLSNVISAKATAVLFIPIAVDVAHELGADPRVFAVAVIFAANCAFATPIGYQTSLLVMGPGRYTFTDFVRAGLPLVLFVWGVFTLFAPWYYGL